MKNHRSKPQTIDWTQPQHCELCTQPLRPSNKNLAEMPNTLRHAAGGLCSKCYRDNRKSKKQRPTTAQNRASLEKYFHRRRSKRAQARKQMAIKKARLQAWLQKQQQNKN